MIDWLAKNSSTYVSCHTCQASQPSCASFLLPDRWAIANILGWKIIRWLLPWFLGLSMLLNTMDQNAWFGSLMHLLEPCPCWQNLCWAGRLQARTKKRSSTFYDQLILLRPGWQFHAVFASQGANLGIPLLKPWHQSDRPLVKELVLNSYLPQYAFGVTALFFSANRSMRFSAGSDGADALSRDSDRKWRATSGNSATRNNVWTILKLLEIFRGILWLFVAKQSGKNKPDWLQSWAIHALIIFDCYIICMGGY